MMSGCKERSQDSELPGLISPVEILRDKWGVNHIYAENQHDLFFTQGYCAARDRLFQFEIWRRQATGTLAEVLGRKELKRDIGSRLFKYRGDMDEELNHYHEDGSDIIHAFVKGVNAYIDHVSDHPEELPVEFKLLDLKPGKWTPDVVISRHQGLKHNIERELQIGRAVAKADPESVRKLLDFEPRQPDITLDPSITQEVLSSDILELYSAFASPVSFDKKDGEMIGTLHPDFYSEDRESEGSNNWVVSGTNTESGMPILANDPHRAISLPSLRYMVHLNAPGWNVIGGGEPEIPGVSIGHNDHGAWGLTIFRTDAEDLYVYDLNPDNPEEYQYKGEWVEMETVEETIAVKGEGTHNAVLRYTLHGPVTYIDTVHMKAFAVRAAWLEAGAAPYLASLRYDQSKNWEDFRDASEYNYLPGENMVWADREGNIGWQVVGIAPIRNHSSGMVPVPGDGRYEWDGYLDIKERPSVYNPSEGFFATANQDVTPPDYPFWNTIAFEWSPPYRGDRINDVLSGDTKRNIRKEKILQTDNYSIPAGILIPMIQKMEFQSDRITEAKDRLKSWDFKLDRESVAAAIYVAWEREIMRSANKRFVPDNLKSLISISLRKVISRMENPDLHFSGNSLEKRDEFLAKTFTDAVDTLSKKLGEDMNSWQYGQEKFKHIRLLHPLHDLLPPDLQQQYALGPLPRHGDANTPNASGGSDNQKHGASFRILVDLDDWDRSLMINSPGQSGNPDSKYYSNLFEMWANDDYFPAYFSREKIREVTDERTIFKPAN